MKLKLQFFVVFLLAGGIFTGCKFIQRGTDDNDETVPVTEPVIEIPVSFQPAAIEAPLFGERKRIENKEPVIKSDDVIYGNKDFSYTEYSYESYKNKPILTVTAKENGLEITKYHDPIWWYVDIYIYNVTENIMNARIVTNEYDNKNVAADTYFYPFVKAGDEYKIYIIKQDKGYQNWTSFESSAVYITALGGEGNFNINSKSFDYDNATKTITFENLELTLPECVKSEGSISGGIYKGALWEGDSKWPWGYKLNKSAICLTDDGGNEVGNFIKNADKISVTLRYKYQYYDSNYNKDFEYETTIIEGSIYDAETDSTKSLVLSGGMQIPNVYIESHSGWKDNSTYHFGDNWKNATIRVEGEGFDFETTEISIKDRGNSTKWTEKTPFSIKFPKKTEVLGMKKAKRWVLMANYYDRSLIRTDFAGYLGNEVFNSYWNASFTPVNVYINDRFVGTYDFGECNKIAKQRVDVQSLEDFADSASDYKDVNEDGKVDIEDAGFIVEIDTATNWDGSLTKSNYKNEVGVSSWAAGERIFFYSSEYCIPFTLKEPDFDDNKYSDSKCKQYGKYAKSKIDAFEKMLVKKDFVSHYVDYIDVVSFIDWYLINEFSKNSDANFQKSVPVTYNPATGKLYMGPNWDFDLAFGNFSNTNCDDPTGWYIHGTKKWCDENGLYCEKNGTYVQSWWINRLFESKAFKKAVKDRWNDRKIYLKNAINQKIVDYANLIYDKIPENEEIIPRLGQDSWNGPSGYASRINYEDEVYYFYDWCIRRYNWMDKEISKW